MIKEKYMTRVKETTLNIVQTQIESIRKKDIAKAGLRLYNNGCIGVSGAIGSYDEGELQARAQEALSLQIPYDFEPSENKTERVEACPEIIKDTDFPGEMEALLAEFRAQQPKFSFFNKIKIVTREVGLVNDQNLNLHFKGRFMAVELGIKEKTSANLLDAFTGYEGRAYDAKELLRLTNDICNAYQNPVQLPKDSKLPVVFTASNLHILKQLIMDLHGQRFATASSLLSGKVGEQIFNDDFTLYQSLNPEETLQPFFDAEGVVNPDYRYTLVDRGRIISPYTDKKTAAKFNLPVTGSSAADYDGVPSLAYLNFKVKESNKTIKELLQGQMGIFVMLSEGGDYTPAGDFATPVQLAFLFDGEKLIGKLPEFQLSSNVFAMFGQDFVGVGKNQLYTLDSEKYIVMNMNVSN